MKFTILSVILLMALGLLIYAQARKGYKKGMTRSFIHLAQILIAALMATLCSVWLAYPIARVLGGASFTEGLLESVTGDLVLSEGLVLAIVRLVISLLLYVPLFFLLCKIFSFVTGICYRKVMQKRVLPNSPYLSESAPYYEKKQRVIGAGTGVVSALLIFIVTVMPLYGIMKTANRAVNLLQRYLETEEDSETSVYAEYLSFFADDAVFVSVDACGGGVLFDMTARTRIGGEALTLNGELTALERIDAGKVLDAVNNLNLTTAEDAVKLTAAVGELEKSTVFRALMVDVIRTASKNWLSGGEFLEMEKPRFSNHVAVEGFVDEALFIFTSTTERTLKADISTLAAFATIFYEYEAVFTSGNYDRIIQAVMDENLEERIRAEIEKNPHMAPLKDAVETLILTVLSQEITNVWNFSTEEQQELFNEICDYLNETLGMDKETRIDQIMEDLSGLLEENDLYVPDGLGEILTESLLDFFPSEFTYVTVNDVQQYFYQFLQPQE